MGWVDEGTRPKLVVQLGGGVSVWRAEVAYYSLEGRYLLSVVFNPTADDPGEVLCRISVLQW